MPLSPDDIAYLKAKGISDDQLQGAEVVDPSQTQQTTQQQGMLQAVGNTLKAHAGGIIGGGAAAQASPAIAGKLWQAVKLLGLAGGEEAIGGGPLDPIGDAAALTTLAKAGSLFKDYITPAIGGYFGSQGGEALQQKAEGDQTFAAQQQAAAEASAQHPIATKVADVAAGAYASGGRFSPSAIPKAIGGDTDAIKNIALQTLVNPAINAGIGYAATGQLPSAGDLAESAVGGALFSEPNVLGKWAGRVGTQKTADPADNTTGQEEAPKKDEGPQSLYTQKDTDGNYTISDNAVRDSYMQNFKKPNPKNFDSKEDYAIAKTRYDKAKFKDTDTMRQELHEELLAKTDAMLSGKKDFSDLTLPNENVNESEQPEDKLGKDEPEPAQEPIEPAEQLRKLGEEDMARQGMNQEDEEEPQKPVEEHVNEEPQPETKHTPEEEPAEPNIDREEELRRLNAELPGNEDDEEPPQEPTKVVKPTVVAKVEPKPQPQTPFAQAKPVEPQEPVGPKADVTKANMPEGALWGLVTKINHLGLDSPIQIRQEFPELKLDAHQSLALWHIAKNMSEYPNVMPPAEPSTVRKGQGKRNKTDSLHVSQQTLVDPKELEKTLGGTESESEGHTFNAYDPHSQSTEYNKAKSSLENKGWTVTHLMDGGSQVTHSKLGRSDAYGQYSIISEHELPSYEKKGHVTPEEAALIRTLWKEGKPDYSSITTPTRTPLGAVNAMKNSTNIGTVLGHFSRFKQSIYKPLADALLASGNKRVLNTRVFTQAGADTSSFKQYADNRQNHIIMKVSHLQSPDVFFEEAIHAFTVEHIPSDMYNLTGSRLKEYYDNYIADPKSDPAIKTLMKAHMYMAKAEGHEDIFFGEEGLAGRNPMKVAEDYHSQGKDPSYGYNMTNFGEFIASAFKDPGMQLKMMSHTMPGESKTIWQKFVDAIQYMLGMGNVKVPSGSILDHVLRAGADLASKEPGVQSAATQEFHAQRQLPKEDIEPTKHMGRFGRFTQSVLDKMSELPHAGVRLYAKGAKAALNEADQLRGKFKTPVIEAGKKLTDADKLQLNKVINKEISEKTIASSLLQNDRQRAFYNEVKKAMAGTADYAIANRIPINQAGFRRLMIKDPTHWPGMANQKVEQVFRDNTNTGEMDRLEKVFNDWNTQKLGMTPAQSQARIDNWKKSIQGSTDSTHISSQDYFNAIRKAQGAPLPPEFREQNPVKAMSRYLDRFSVAATHYKHVESNNKILSALGQTQNAWGQSVPKDPHGSIATNPVVQTAIGQFKREITGQAEHNEESVSALATSALISGPPLEVHKLVSNQVGAIKFAENPFQYARMIGHALTNVKAGYQHAKENGLYKPTALSYRDMLNGSLTSAERLLAAAHVVRQVSTLGGLTTKANAALLQSQMEYIIPSKIQRALKGDVTSQQFLKNLDPNYTKGKTYSLAEQRQLASLAAGYIHGTSDIRSMPAWMLKDGEVSGFFKLAHWSVAQTNNFMKDVYTPATRGNYTPLLNSVFGSLVGGYLIKELREKISGRASQIPSLQEVMAGDNPNKAPLLAYNAVAAMQYSGFGGLLSQVAKYPFDFAYKNSPQGATFPLDEVASDLMGTIKEVSSTIANDPNVNWVDLAAKVTQQTLQSNMQLAKIAINQGINNGLITGMPAEKKELSDSLAKLRRFDEVEGLPYQDLDESSNPYMNLEQKKFKSTQDLGQAAQMLPQLVNNIMTTYAGKPDVMMNKLQALKTNQYETFPSMKKMPMQFMKYLGYLQREEGPEKAQAELQNYLHHEMINQAKAGLVP